jgi:betaine-aldehyde dehydrogenase
VAAVPDLPAALRTLTLDQSAERHCCIKPLPTRDAVDFPVTEGPLAAGGFYRPSIIEVQDLDTPLIQQELFGPVQTFEVFTNDADAIRRVNATEFGLAAAVFTRDEIRARNAEREIRAGLVWTNCWALLSEQFEEGGYKQSGHGYLCGPRAIEQFQNLKVYSQLAPPTA